MRTRQNAIIYSLSTALPPLQSALTIVPRSLPPTAPKTAFQLRIQITNFHKERVATRFPPSVNRKASPLTRGMTPREDGGMGKTRIIVPFVYIKPRVMLPIIMEIAPPATAREWGGGS